MRDSDKAYELIIDMLMSGKISGGQEINEKQLMEVLNLGKTPIREALTRLAQEGYVTAVPHKGMSVVNFNIGELNSLFRLRLALADYYAERLMESITDEQIEEIEKMSAAGDEDPYMLDYHFHRMLSKCTNDKYLDDVLRKLENLSIIGVRPLHYESQQKNEKVASEYEEILDALKKRDCELLKAVMKKHIPAYVTLGYR